MQINRSTFSILFYLNTGKQKKSGRCPVVGRINIDGKSKAFSTGMDIEPNFWDAKEGLAIVKPARKTDKTDKTSNMSGKNETVSINRRIEELRAELTAHYKRMIEENGYVTAEALKNALQGIRVKDSSLMQEFAQLVEEKQKSIGTKIGASTYRKYPNAYRHLKGFIHEKYNVNDIPFGQVDIAFVEAYARYLRIEKQMTAGTVGCNIKPLRTCVRRAKNKGLIRQDPFTGYIPEKTRSAPRWLSNDEIERLMQVEAKRPAWNFTRDMFIFCVFTGISCIDLRNLKHSNIQQQEDGSLWIVLDRQKTGTASHIPLLDIPMQILNKYKNSEFAGENGHVFKLQTHVNMNLQLKHLAKAARIDKRLTFHMSRFSFATTICLTGGVPIETLSQMMGHLSIKTTQIYAEVVLSKINEDMTKLEERIQGKYELADNTRKAKVYSPDGRKERYNKKNISNIND